MQFSPQLEEMERFGAAVMGKKESLAADRT
jgi:hypothetical protein